MRRRQDKPIKRTYPSGRVSWIARYTDKRGRRRIAKPPWNNGKGAFDREYKAKEAIDWAYEQEERPESATVGGYFETWTAIHPRSPRTNATNEHRISRLLDIDIEGVPLRSWELRDLRRRHVHILVDVMLRKQGRAQTGVINILRALSAMCEDAITDDKAEVNPVKGVKVRANDPRIRKPRRAVRVFTFEQMHAFAVAAREAWLDRHPKKTDYAPVVEALVRAFGDTGARLGEILPLRRADLRAHVFEIRRTAHEGVILEGTKTDHGDPTAGRTAPCPPTLERMAQGLPARIDTDLLFPTPTGKLWRERNFYRDIWYPAQAESGLDIRPHEMRHSYVTHLRAAGIDDADLAKVTGHTLETMIGRYSHALGESFDAIRRAIG